MFWVCVCVNNPPKIVGRDEIGWGTWVFRWALKKSSTKLYCEMAQERLSGRNVSVTTFSSEELVYS